MTSPVLSRRRWKLHAHGRHIVIEKGPREHPTHPLMKAFLWALYLPQYPNISVEVRIGDRYKPDVVAFAPGGPLHLQAGAPLFWGEAGQVGVDKIHSLLRRYRDTHFAIARWQARTEPLLRIVEEAAARFPRRAPFDVINFGEDSAERFIDDDGIIRLTHQDLEWLRL